MQNFRMNLWKWKCEMIDRWLAIVGNGTSVEMGSKFLRELYEQMYSPSQVKHPENNC